ncbi:DUF1217 domain-containing protein [Microvirga terrestris]|uniref:DUF1217 domain-containing protein n=1 Tax=Microvirga terrestris TaxID=2791024 RepID=A0ABS0HRN0_9HYPH|nr:DUF1217 domain-containing protein [Microvirga terrestris]MBF9195860.1 DUF1217 domain-containing protein [Microvirga terrestris]
MISTSTRYQIVTKDLARTKALIEKDPATKREIEYYRANIKTIKTIEDFIKNDRIFKFAMKAYGLEDMAYAKGMMKKILQEGVVNPLSMANKMSNPLYKEFAKAFDFRVNGSNATSAASATTEAVQKYVENALEKKEGEQNQGVQLAMYFKRKASSVKTTMGLLADKALLKFVQTTFNIPQNASKADLDIQVRNLEKHINIKDLQDPKKVDKLIQRFNAMWDVTNASTASVSPVALLFDPSSVQEGFSMDLMMSIAKLRPGGF